MWRIVWSDCACMDFLISCWIRTNLHIRLVVPGREWMVLDQILGLRCAAHPHVPTGCLCIGLFLYFPWVSFGLDEVSSAVSFLLLFLTLFPGAIMKQRGVMKFKTESYTKTQILHMSLCVRVEGVRVDIVVWWSITSITCFLIKLNELFVITWAHTHTHTSYLSFPIVHIVFVVFLTHDKSCAKLIQLRR